ncbi:MAG: DUF167 domain-containing protein [Candidatus Omnitrophica bacterium]|nr:DUF167 domain-containing protein [Candidatus Omnitrophota bacterium]
MKINVTVKPNAKQERVEKTGEGKFTVRVKAKPQEGKANEAVAKALAEYFGVAKSRVVLLHGQASKHKVFEVL